MRDALKSTSYWATIISVSTLGGFSPRLEDAHLLLASVAACYFVGRGIAQFPKVPTAGWKSREFVVLLLSCAFLVGPILAGVSQAALALVVLVGSYSIGRGLCEFYRSKVSMVLNR